jgi:flagellar M-ring protein FliF
VGVSKSIEIFRSLEARAQIALAASAIAVVATLVFLFNYAQRPSYVTLASGVEATESGQIAKSLEGAGITYSLEDGGSTIAVEKGAEARARVALAQDGLPSGGHVGFELFDKKSSLGTTDFEQKVEYQRALEGEIARTIEAVDGVQGVEVQLVLPQDSVFLDDGTPASAAVLLKGGDTLGRDAVAGIARLVASSVESLDAKNVTITDDTGSLLWPSDGAGGDGATAKLEAEQRYGTQLSAQIDSMLAATLGTGKGMARVHATLNLDRTTIDKVTYGKSGVPITATQDTEQLGGKAGAATTTNGAAGIASNLPGYSGSATAAAAASKGATYARVQGTTEYGVDKQVESTTIAPGSVQKLDVALVLDKSIPAAQVAQLKASVASLAGIDAKRGDTINVAQVEFAKAEETAKAAAPSPLEQLGGPLGVGKWALIVLGCLVFLFMVRRGLKKREGESLGPEPTWLREIVQARPLHEVEATQIMQQRQIDPAAQQRHAVTQQVEEIARRQPEQIAQQVSSWMHE